MATSAAKVEVEGASAAWREWRARAVASRRSRRPYRRWERNAVDCPRRRCPCLSLLLLRLLVCLLPQHCWLLSPLPIRTGPAARKCYCDRCSVAAHVHAHAAIMLPHAIHNHEGSASRFAHGPNSEVLIARTWQAPFDFWHVSCDEDAAVCERLPVRCSSVCTLRGGGGPLNW